MGGNSDMDMITPKERNDKVGKWGCRFITSLRSFTPDIVHSLHSVKSCARTGATHHNAPLPSLPPHRRFDHWPAPLFAEQTCPAGAAALEES